MAKEFSYEITEHIAVLSKKGDTTKELNKVSYNGREAKYDIRNWKRNKIEGEKILRGITLTDEEFKALKETIKKDSSH